MNKIITCIGLVAFTSLMYSCTPKAAKSVSSTSTNSTAAYTSFVSNYNAQALENGKTLYQDNCGKCHKFKDETKFSIEKWDKILDRMIPKAKLSADDGKLVRAYVYNLKLNEQ